MADPRVYFASERTLLAWVRSGLTVMGLGFVVAKFGLLLSSISAATGRAPGPQHKHWPSSALGIALVILGVVTILGALQNHRRYVRTLAASDRPDQPLPWLPSVLTLAAAVGLLLAAYLLVV